MFLRSPKRSFGAGTEGTEKCSACETGFALNADMQCATDSDRDGTADSVDAFPFDAERTAGLCGELSTSVVVESGSESEQMTKRATNDATGEVYVARDERLIASGTGHRDDPFIIPLSDGCRSINFVWDFTGLSIPDTITNINFFSDGPYHHARFTNLPEASTIYAQTINIDRVTSDPTLGLIRDTVINGNRANSLRYVASSTPGTIEPFTGRGAADKGQEHSLTQNFLGISYITGRSSTTAWRIADGRIRFRVLIEPSE